MLNRLLVLLLSLAALPALAQDAEALGFTQDGAYFVIARHESIGDPDNTIADYVIYDTAWGWDVPYTPEEYKEWAAENPLAPLKVGPTSPDGKRQLDAGDKRLKWEKGRLRVPTEQTWTGSEEDAAPNQYAPSQVTVHVKAGKKRSPSVELKFTAANSDQAVECVWSPDGKRVAYLVHVTGDAHADHKVFIGSAGGPRVQVLSVKDTPAETLSQVQAALEGAGLVPLHNTTPQAARPTTVIFAAKGFEAAAKKAAAVLPGSKVEKLTWKPGYDVVVALGGK